jgi:hypothetical protein
MKIPAMTAGWLLAAAALTAAPQTAPQPAKPAPAKAEEPKKEVKKTKQGKEKPPFYEKYLSDTLPLDVAIRESAGRVAKDPDNAGLHNDFANLLARRGFAKEAFAEYSRASKLDRKFFLADYNAGLLYEKEGKPEHAITAFRRSIHRKPGFPPARFHLGLLFESRGEDRAAVEQYAKALRIDDSLRLPSRNPLAVQTRLLYRVSLENYPRDLAAATLAVDARFAQPELFKKVALDRPVDAEEVKPPEEEAEVPPVSPAKWTPSASAAPVIGTRPAKVAPTGQRPVARPIPQKPPAANPSGTRSVPPPPGGNTRPVLPGGIFNPSVSEPPPPPPPPPAEPPPPEGDEDGEPPPAG